MRIPNSQLKVGGRPPLDLQLWSWLGCFGILRHISIPSSWLMLGGQHPKDLQLWSQLGCMLWNPSAYDHEDFQLWAQVQRMTSFGSTTLVSARMLGNPSAYQDSQLSPQVGRPPLDLQLWSRLGCFGILQHMSIPSSRLTVGGQHPKDLQLWSRLGCMLWNPSAYEDSLLWAQGRMTTS